jgi:hypothetical protein
MLPERTSPTAKTPGRLVSSRCGVRTGRWPHDLHRAASDDEERDAAITSFDEHLAGGDPARTAVGGDALHLFGRQRRKQVLGAGIGGKRRLGSHSHGE